MNFDWHDSKSHTLVLWGGPPYCGTTYLQYHHQVVSILDQMIESSPTNKLNLIILLFNKHFWRVILLLYSIPFILISCFYLGYFCRLFFLCSIWRDLFRFRAAWITKQSKISISLCDQFLSILRRFLFYCKPILLTVWLIIRLRRFMVCLVWTPLIWLVEQFCI